jgi:hypothetical protein
MASCIPFDCLALDEGEKIHNFAVDTLKVYLTNVAPDKSADTVYGTPADLPSGGGYTAGGISTGANTWSQASGLASLALGTNITFTATTGFGPFRYAVLYNFSAAARNLIGYWDNGVPVSLGAGGTFEVDFSNPILTNKYVSA